MIINFKEILAPTKHKVILTILLFFITRFLGSLALGISESVTGYILYFIVMISNLGLFLGNYIGGLFLKPGYIEPQVARNIQYLGIILQIIYVYLVISIFLYFRNRNKKVETLNENPVQPDLNHADPEAKSHFKTFFKAALLIIVVLFVAFIGLTFYTDSQNKKSIREFEQSGNTTEWKSYTSKAGRYQVQYPSWWKVSSGDERGFVYLRGDSDAIGDERSDIFLNPTDNPFGNQVVIAHCHGLEYCKREMEDSLKFMIDTSNIVLDGFSAIKGNNKVIVTEPYKDAYYEISSSGDLKNQPIFEKMISTFRFIQ